MSQCPNVPTLPRRRKRGQPLTRCAAEKFESRSRIERPPGGPEAWGCREACAYMHGGQAEIGPYLVLKGANAPTYQLYVDKGGHTPPRFCAKLSKDSLCAPRGPTPHRRRTRSHDCTEASNPKRAAFKCSACLYSKPTPRAVWRDDLATVYRVSLWTHTSTPPALKYCRSLTRAVDVVGRMTRRSGSLRKAIETARRWRRLPVAMRFRDPSFTIGVIGTSTGCLGAMARSFCAFFPLRAVRVQMMGRGHHRLE